MSSDHPNSQESPLSREQAPHADVLAEHAESIRKLGKRMIADVIEIGRRLSECKQLLGHGNWLPWVRREFRWAERTARNYASVYEFSQSESANIADLAIDITSVYLLAAPSTPKEARAEVLGRVEAGEVLPRAEIKRIVGEVREPKAAAGAAIRGLTAREIIKGFYGDFAKLPPVVRQKIVEERPENRNLAIADAVARQRQKPPYRELLDTLDALEIMAKQTTGKIISAIPVEHIPATAARVEWAKDLLIKLDAKLQRDGNLSKFCAADGAKSVAELIKEAHKASINEYGCADLAEVVEAIWPKLNPAQIEQLRSVQFGPAFRAAVERVMRAREGGR